MKKNFRFQWCCLFMSVLILAACQVKRPEGVIPEANMENLLYDYHLAKAMGEGLPYEENYKRVLYVDAVFKKHGTTEETFDSSMVWYTRNTELLSKIYEKVNKRLKTQQDAINHLIALRDDKPKTSAPGDSIDVWAWQRRTLLTGVPLNNKLTFTLPADTNFKKKDALLWEVRYQFPKGKASSHEAAIMAMQIVYGNDSTITSGTKKILKSGKYHILLQSDTLPIKEIRGFIYYPQGKQIKALLADQISLIRYHSDTLSVAKDSLRADSLRTDSLKAVTTKADSIKRKENADTTKVGVDQQRSNPKDFNHPSNEVRPVRPEQRETEERILKEKQQLEKQQRMNQRRSSGHR